MSQTDFKKCPIRKAFDILGGKWAFLILLELEEKKRYGELKKSIPDISEKVLINKLRLLEKNDFISRKDFKEIPPHVEYSLTKMGKEALKIAPALARIGDKL